MNRDSVAWAAGLFEGEGSLCLNVRPGRGRGSATRSQVIAKLGMTDQDVVARFASVVGFGNVRGPITPAKEHYKMMYEWSIHGFERVQALVAMVWPYLGERRRAKAREVLQASRYVQARGDRPNCPKGHPYSGENLMLERIQRDGRTYLGRRCRICRTAQVRDRMRRKRAA